MLFEWDQAKALRNHAKHGVPFEALEAMFADPNHFTFVDDRKDYGEVRELIVGMADGALLTAVFTRRGQTSIRVISARIASREERKAYADRQIRP